MARTLNSLLARIVLFVLVAHGILLPILYLSLSRGARTGGGEMFVNHVREHTRFIADLIENQDPAMGDEDLVALLDAIVLGPNGVFAELHMPDRLLSSTVLPAEAGRLFKEDFAFGDNDDETYYLTMPVNIGEQTGNLVVGYSEQSALEDIGRAQDELLLALTVYFLAALGLAVAMATAITRPMSALQQASRRVARGEVTTRLSTSSTIEEVIELARDLELMRDQLVQANTRLADEIAERRVLEARLRHSQRIETIGTMAGGIAHEFNNILVPITLYTKVAMEDLPQSSELQVYLGRIHGAAQRARKLVHKILAFSRQLEAEEKQSVDLARTVREAVELFGSLSPANVVIETRIPEEECLVFGDSTMLHQVVLNLCSNALRAIRGSDGRIVVSLDKQWRPSGTGHDGHPAIEVGYARLCVEDNGIGMDAATSERIFEPFFTTREVGEGTGLGLSVVHGIVMGHGGDIMVNSDKGRGTVFTILLPLLPGRDPRDLQPGMAPPDDAGHQA